jgi:phosphatidylglycerol:prolipoprotein diacylglycerol transferase
MTYLLLYGILRFIVEFFRGDAARGFLVGPVSVSQGISILMIFAAVAGFVVLRRRNARL